MGSHYIDIHLRAGPELAPHQLLTGVYARLHRALVQLTSEDIGVSFPKHNDQAPTLGSHLRLHGTECSLNTLLATDFLRGVQDDLMVGSIQAVPQEIQHRVVGRVQVKSNVERLRRRAIKRHGIDAASVAGRIPDTVAKRLTLPFITLGSRSTGQAHFPIFIRHGPLLTLPIAGKFNCYGLSPQATIAWF